MLRKLTIIVALGAALAFPATALARGGRGGGGFGGGGFHGGGFHGGGFGRGWGGGGWGGYWGGYWPLYDLGPYYGDAYYYPDYPQTTLVDPFITATTPTGITITQGAIT